MWKSNYVLCLTTLFFVIPLCYILYELIQSRDILRRNCILSYILLFALSMNVILSIMFWCNPVKKSSIHMMDSLLVRISLVLFIVYFCLQSPSFKELAIFAFILCVIGMFAYYSNYYSSIYWCNKKHIRYHSLFHFFCGIGCMYVLL
jgi:hypothetical protein